MGRSEVWSDGGRAPVSDSGAQGTLCWAGCTVHHAQHSAGWCTALCRVHCTVQSGAPYRGGGVVHLVHRVGGRWCNEGEGWPHPPARARVRTRRRVMGNTPMLPCPVPTRYEHCTLQWDVLYMLCRKNMFLKVCYRLCGLQTKVWSSADG